MADRYSVGAAEADFSLFEQKGGNIFDDKVVKYV